MRCYQIVHFCKQIGTIEAIVTTIAIGSPCEQKETRNRKHYLSASSFAGNKKESLERQILADTCNERRNVVKTRSKSDWNFLYQCPFPGWSAVITLWLIKDEQNRFPIPYLEFIRPPVFAGFKDLPHSLENLDLCYIPNMYFTPVYIFHILITQKWC